MKSFEVKQPKLSRRDLLKATIAAPLASLVPASYTEMPLIMATKTTGMYLFVSDPNPGIFPACPGSELLERVQLDCDPPILYYRKKRK